MNRLQCRICVSADVDSSRQLGIVQVQIDGTQIAARRAAASCVVDQRWLLIHGGFDGTAWEGSPALASAKR